MPDIWVAVDYAIAQSGKPYHAYGDRFGPDYYDCSGLVIGSLRHAGIAVPSDVGNTVGLYNWAKRVGGLVSVQQGVATKGAIMIKGRWYGYGPLGHTSFSLGDGREMAAHGRRTGIGITTLNASFYQDAFIIPGVDYHLGPPPPPPAPTWRIPLIWLPHPEGKGTWIAVTGSPGRVVFLSVNGALLEQGMDVDENGKPDPESARAFGDRHIDHLEHRTRNDGKPGFKIRTVEPTPGYVSKSQI